MASKCLILAKYLASSNRRRSVYTKATPEIARTQSAWNRHFALCWPMAELCDENEGDKGEQDEQGVAKEYKAGNMPHAARADAHLRRCPSR